MKKTSKEEHPAWLVRMENGSIGEARTKSFLIDRFWILERSVDIDIGADFIIQRRLKGINLLDKEPPRLGVVQVKFFESDKTTQYIHKEYVLGTDKQPRKEFFLICHTGKGDQSFSYLLSASDIVDEFKLTDQTHTKPNRYAIPGKTLLQSSKYQIVSKDISLERMENALKNADFTKNRRFLSWALPGVGEINENIIPLYQEPLDNFYGDIPEMFKDLKDKAQKAVFDVEEVIELLNKILETDDPEKALETAQELEYQYGNCAPLPDDLFNEDFLQVVQAHKQQYSVLRENGILDLYLKLANDCHDFITSDLAKQMPLKRNKAYILTISYNITSMTDYRFSSEIKNVNDLFKEKNDRDYWRYSDAPDSYGIYQSTSDLIVLYILAGRCGYNEYVNGEWIEDSKKTWEEKLQTVSRNATRQVMYKIYSEHFGELY